MLRQLDLDFDLGLGDLPPPLASDNIEANNDNNDARGVRPRDSNITQAGELNVPDAFRGGDGGPDTSATGIGAAFEGVGYDDPYGNGGGVVAEGHQGDFFEGNREASVINGRRETPALGDNAPVAGPPTPPASDGIDLSNAAAQGQSEEAINAADNDNNNNTKPASKKAKKPLQPLKDKYTTLHADEITRNREAYSDQMKKMTLRKDLERFERGQKELVLDMMTALPLQSKFTPLPHKAYSVVLRDYRRIVEGRWPNPALRFRFQSKHRLWRTVRRSSSTLRLYAY